MTFLDCYVSGYNFDGGDIDVISDARDANNCQIDCSKNALCNYWTFETGEKKCHMKREILKVVKSNVHQSGPKKCLKKSDAENDMKEMSWSQGVDLKLGDIRKLASSTKETCQYHCQRQQKCAFFTLFNGVSINFNCFVF